MWKNVFCLNIWYAVSLVTVSGLGPTWGVVFPAAHSALNPADSDVRVKVREYVKPEPRESCCSPQCRFLCQGTGMSKLWQSLKFEKPADFEKWDAYSKSAIKKKGAISKKATHNKTYLESLKLSPEDVQKETTQKFLKSKKDALKTEINTMSNEFDLYMDEIMGFLMSLDAQSEDSIKIIELIKEDILAEKVKYTGVVLSHQADLDATYQPAVPSVEARSDNVDTLPVSPVKPIIRADLAPNKLLSMTSTPSELEE